MKTENTIKWRELIVAFDGLGDCGNYQKLTFPRFSSSGKRREKEETPSHGDTQEFAEEFY